MVDRGEKARLPEDRHKGKDSDKNATFGGKNAEKLLYNKGLGNGRESQVPS